MPQYRKLYTKTVESLDVNDMPDDFSRLMWVLLPLALCQEGRGIDNAAWVKAKLFPLRTDVSLPMIEEALGWFAARHMICRYQVEGRAYFSVPTWHWYQGDTSREGKTHYPPPPKETCPEETSAPSPSGPALRNEGERAGSEGERRTCPELAPRYEGERGDPPTRDLSATNSEAQPESDESQSERVGRRGPVGPRCSSTDADAEAEAEAEATGHGAAAPPGPPRLTPQPQRLVPQPHTFEGWLDRIQQAENRPVVLREMFETLFPGRDPPTHRKLGAFAVKVGGASRLAELMWKCSARPPTGDVLAYLYGVHRHNGSALAYRDERDLANLDALNAVIHR
jgi:hypothetical protein